MQFVVVHLAAVSPPNRAPRIGAIRRAIVAVRAAFVEGGGFGWRL